DVTYKVPLWTRFRPDFKKFKNVAVNIPPEIILLGSDTLDNELYVIYVDTGGLYVDTFFIPGMRFNLMDLEHMGSGLKYVDNSNRESREASVKVSKGNPGEVIIHINGPGNDEEEYRYRKDLKKVDKIPKQVPTNN